MIKVMFVCHGNICRSPMAEFVFKDIVAKQNLSNEFIIDSSGDRIFVTDVANLEASYLMSGDGVIIKGPNKLEGGKIRTVTVHFVYYRK